MAGPFPSSEARLAMLSALPLSAEERETLLAQLGELVRGLEALEAFVNQKAEPATGFDPLLGGEP